MAKEQEALWSLEKAEQSAKDIQFWKAEYMKRKALFDPDYKEILNSIEWIHREWCLYIQDELKDESKLFERYHSDFINHLQRHFVYSLQNYPYKDDGVNFSDRFSTFLGREDVKFVLSTFFRFSTKYGYKISDLVSFCNAEYILKNIDSIYLEPPLYHINEYYHRRFSEDVLSLFYSEFSSLSLIKSMFGAEINTITRSKYTNEDESIGYIHPYISSNKFNRKADFIIMGQTMHADFELQGIHEEVCDHITWRLYENKKKRNMPLTPYEENTVIKLYKKMAQGEYYASHRAARAIGLWLWDSRHHFAKCKSDRAAVRALREAKLDMGYTESEDRTLLRLLENTRKCIESSQVIAINKQSGKRRERDKK